MAGAQTPEEEFAAAFNDEDTGSAQTAKTASDGIESSEQDQGIGIDPAEAAESDQGSADDGAGAPAVAVVIEPPPKLLDDEDERAADGGEQSEQIESVEEVAEAVESGQMTVDEAIRTLNEDFGDSFTKLLDVLITARAEKIAEKKVATVARTVDDVIADIVDDRQRSHFEAIADAHPDFMEVANSQAMQDYLASLPDDQRAEAQNTIDRGKAKKIIALLSAVKAYGNQSDSEDSISAAEGVRSGGLRIPDKPKIADDYESAWAEA